MTDLTDRYVALVARPKGVPEARHFEVREAPAPDLSQGQILVRNSYWSVDPAMRGWVNDAPNYLPPVEIGAAMRSFAVGEVMQSLHPDFAEGEIVTGMFEWRRYSV
ncbi:MAG: NADP-dependent oxidoreductase, partial [Pseudomonadota bacterium]